MDLVEKWIFITQNFRLEKKNKRVKENFKYYCILPLGFLSLLPESACLLSLGPAQAIF